MNTNRVLQRQATWLTAVLALLGSGSCSLLYDLSTHQCNTDQDCLKMGERFTKTVCRNEACVAVAAKGGSSAVGGLGGTDTSGGTSSSGGNTGFGGTTDFGGASGMGSTTNTAGTTSSAGAAGTTVLPSCSNEQCIIDHGSTWICRNNACVNLTTDDCPVLIPRNSATNLLKKQDVIVIGGYAAMANPANYYESVAIINWDLVFDDFNKASFINGLPGYAGGGTRPVVGLICSSTGATEQSINRSMAHLTDTAQAPAILSTLSANFLYQAWLSQHPDGSATSSAANPAFFMSTGSADLRLANLADEGLMWHMLGDPRALAAPVVALVKQMEPYINAQRAANWAINGIDDPSTPLRVTLISSDDPMMADIASVLLAPATANRPGTNLVFNGKSALDNGTSFNWKVIDSALQHAEPKVTAAIQELSARPPHLIIAMATSEFVAPGGVLPTVENTWATVAQGMIRPYYVMSHRIYNWPELTANMKVFSGVTPALDTRVVGVNYALAQEERAKTLYASYLARLKTTYQGTLDLAGTENHYDGAYYLLYSLATAAASFSTPTGSQIAYGLTSRIISEAAGAESVDVGYDALSGANTGSGTLARLFSDRVNYKLSLYGTEGPPNFDRFSGTRVSTTSAWCMTKASSTVFNYTADGLIFNPTNQTYSLPTAGVPACLGNYCKTVSTGTPPTCQ